MGVNFGKSTGKMLNILARKGNGIGRRGADDSRTNVFFGEAQPFGFAKEAVVCRLLCNCRRRRNRLAVSKEGAKKMAALYYLLPSETDGSVAIPRASRGAE